MTDEEIKARLVEICRLPGPRALLRAQELIESAGRLQVAYIIDSIEIAPNDIRAKLRRLALLGEGKPSPLERLADCVDDA